MGKEVEEYLEKQKSPQREICKKLNWKRQRANKIIDNAETNAIINNEQ